jgi:cytochrome d ubiquinol oxidase subunit I
MQRLGHVIIGAILSGAFLVLSVNAYYIIKKKYLDIAKPAFKIALVVDIVFSLAQLYSGDRSANGVAVNQPVKLAALEGHYDSSAAADMYLLGWVNKQTKQTVGIKIPGGLSFLIHGDFKTPVPGLNAVEKNLQPPQVNAVFQFYHIMILIGFTLIALSLFALYKWKRGTLFNSNWLMHIFMWSVLLPQIANQCGWFAAEMGRQPWVVYGLLRTSDAFSKTVRANQVLFSLIMFIVVYSVLFILFLYLMNKKIKQGYEHVDSK